MIIDKEKITPARLHEMVEAEHWHTIDVLYTVCSIMGVTTPEQLPLERLADGLHAFTGKQTRFLPASRAIGN
jgi:hypothetical protein